MAISALAPNFASSALAFSFVSFVLHYFLLETIYNHYFHTLTCSCFCHKSMAASTSYTWRVTRIMIRQFVYHVVPIGSTFKANVYMHSMAGPSVLVAPSFLMANDRIHVQQFCPIRALYSELALSFKIARPPSFAGSIFHLHPKPNTLL